VFLRKLLKDNKPLVEETFKLLEEGIILPDTYVIDYDMLMKNAGTILKEAQKNNVNLYFMLKQFGTNPIIAKGLLEIGYKSSVVVDFKEALTMMKNNIPIGHVGHLVQVPNSLLDSIIKYGVEFITVYSYEKLELINEIAKKNNKVQKVMLRVVDDKSSIYAGQESGFFPKEIISMISKIKGLKHVSVEGLTSFPCFLYNSEKGRVNVENNVSVLHEVKKQLEEKGFTITQMNMPSVTATNTIKMIAENGGTHGEPGHGMSGTTPYHQDHDAVEKIAYLYVTEVSHNFKENSYCFGGGHYRRSHVKEALIGKDIKNAVIKNVIPPSADSIDYHFGIEGYSRVGDYAIMSFRTQMFVVRSDIAIVSGIGTKNVKVLGVFNQRGEQVRWNDL